MAQQEVGDSVLSNRGFVHILLKWKPFTVLVIKWALKIAMWAFFITWVAVYFLYPTEPLEGVFEKILLATGGTFFGSIGGVFLVFSGPIIIIALLAVVYLTAFPRENHEVKKMKCSRFRLWTLPIFVNGPFGIISAAELIGILVFAAYIICAAYAYTMYNLHLVSKMSLPSKEKSYKLLEYSGLRFASIGFSCMGFLFLPVTRGSILLKLIDVPFERAARYHVWLGHVTMAMFTLHGLCFLVLWSLEGSLLHEIVRWQSNNIANLPGVIVLFVGLLMWVTSLNPVRKRYFELFYYTHHLYTIFIVVLALHVGDSVFSCAAGGIFLFILDRFLRFWQSRREVGVVSATRLPCGTLELVLSKPRDMKYNALSLIFIRIRDLSWLQWHPFSVSSSPLDGKHHLSVLIKVLGDWTGEMRDKCSNVLEQSREVLPCQPYSRITAYVEGPYGHDSAYHLAYENLILVAGGIGISPLLAILRDIMHRTRENKCCLPKNVLVVWAVKRSRELSLLSMIDPKFICPSISEKVYLEIQTYVTQELEPPLEDGNHSTSEIYSFPVTNGSSMSGLVGTANNIWSGIYIFSSTIGFIILFGLMEALYVTPFDVKCWWFKGLLFVICMIVSVVVFGGVVVFLWNQWERRASNREKYANGHEISDIAQYDDPKMQNNASESRIARMNSTHYGCRPNFPEIFSCVSERWGNVLVGVIACGPQSLQTSVAAECRSRTIWRREDQPIFHFYCHSFDL